MRLAVFDDDEFFHVLTSVKHGREMDAAKLQLAGFVDLHAQLAVFDDGADFGDVVISVEVFARLAIVDVKRRARAVFFCENVQLDFVERRFAVTEFSVEKRNDRADSREDRVTGARFVVRLPLARKRRLEE